jgi:hypothetical protein
LRSFSPERVELGDTEIFLVQAPTGELRLSGRRRRVGVLHFNQPIAPPIRERRRFQIDAVDAETVQFLECGGLARDALDQVSKTRRLVVAVGDRQDATSTDMVASAGSSSSRKLPKIACEPTTITSGRSMIWQAVRMACSNWSRRISWPYGHVHTLVLREQPAHRRNLTHLDRVPVQPCQDAVEPWHIAAIDQRHPPVEIAPVRLAADAVAEPLQVALDGRPPVLQARSRQMR